MSPEHIRIAELAKEDKERKFSSIAHLLTMEALHEAFKDLRKDASAGVDRVTYTEYATGVQENLQQLHDRLKSGKYRAQPLRRIYIPKEDGRQRPISIPSLEDKIVQKAAVDLLNAIYEQDFLDCSWDSVRVVAHRMHWTRLAGSSVDDRSRRFWKPILQDTSTRSSEVCSRR
jgi:RNA-directed DNA polymerase